MNELYDGVQNADAIVFATPVYYYAVSGQLKTFMDRLNPLYTRDNRFREVYLLATSAEPDRRAMDGAIKDVQGWADCYAGVRFGGVVYGTGVNDVGEINGTSAPAEAYAMGKAL